MLRSQLYERIFEFCFLLQSLLGEILHLHTKRTLKSSRKMHFRDAQKCVAICADSRTGREPPDTPPRTTESVSRVLLFQKPEPASTPAPLLSAPTPTVPRVRTGDIFIASRFAHTAENESKTVFHCFYNRKNHEKSPLLSAPFSAVSTSFLIFPSPTPRSRRDLGHREEKIQKFLDTKENGPAPDAIFPKNHIFDQNVFIKLLTSSFVF